MDPKDILLRHLLTIRKTDSEQIAQGLNWSAEFVLQSIDQLHAEKPHFIQITKRNEFQNIDVGIMNNNIEEIKMFLELGGFTRIHQIQSEVKEQEEKTKSLENEKQKLSAIIKWMIRITLAIVLCIGIFLLVKVFSQ
jgi:hypothetical protein